MKRFLEWLRSIIPPATTIAEELQDRLDIDNLVRRSLKYKSQRDDLMKAAKALLVLHYGDLAGDPPRPYTEARIAFYAQDLIEKVDGRPFDQRTWLKELRDSRELED